MKTQDKAAYEKDLFFFRTAIITKITKGAVNNGSIIDIVSHATL